MKTQDVLIYRNSDVPKYFEVWADSIDGVEKIPGVIRIYKAQEHEFHIWTDPRYDQDEIEKEILEVAK